MSINEKAASDRHSRWLAMLAAFLAGGVAFGLWQKNAAEQRHSTFIRACPNLSTSNPVALRTPEGRIVIVSLVDIPEQYMSAFCPGPSEIGQALGVSPGTSPGQ